MLISDSHEFIFVHNYKVAGRSVKEALEEYATPPIERMSWMDCQLARFGLRTVPEYPAHMTAQDIRECFPEEWEEYFTFGFVRNPWSWQVSLYAFMQEQDDHPQHALIQSMDGFEEYIKWRVEEDKHLQSEFFVDENGDLMVDFVGHLETIQDDFRTVCEGLGIEASLPHKNASSHRAYRDYYNERTRRLVDQHFQKDIRRFGYRFDGVADASPVTTS